MLHNGTKGTPLTIWTTHALRLLSSERVSGKLIPIPACMLIVEYHDELICAEKKILMIYEQIVVWAHKLEREKNYVEREVNGGKPLVSAQLTNTLTRATRLIEMGTEGAQLNKVLDTLETTDAAMQMLFELRNCHNWLQSAWDNVYTSWDPDGGKTRREDIVRYAEAADMDKSVYTDIVDHDCRIRLFDLVAMTERN